MRCLFKLLPTVLLLGACASVDHVGRSEPDPLRSLMAVQAKSLALTVAQELEEDGRLQAIRDIGRKAGRSEAIAWRNRQLNAALAMMNDELAIIFNFEQVLLGGVYLPPRIERVQGEVQKKDDWSLNVIREGYRITSEPQLVTQQPTHLHYLYRLQTKAEPPNPLGLPRANKPAEIRTWIEAVKQGWEEGLRHADIAFIEDVNLLHRDFTGILRYVELANKGIVAMPSIDKQERGIVMSTDGRVLNIGDEVLQIDASPLFTSPALWRAIGTPLSEQAERWEVGTNE